MWMAAAGFIDTEEKELKEQPLGIFFIFEFLLGTDGYV